MKKEDHLTIDIQQAFGHDTAYIAKLLNISEGDAQDLKSKFQVTIKNINRLEESDLNQELFDKLFGKDIVKTEEEFKAKITEEIEAMMVQNSEQRLQYDLYQLGLEKFNFNLPDEFLKRWLKATNKKIVDHELEEGYADFAKKLRWTLAETKIIKENNIEIKYEEVFDAAKNRIEAQFKMYSPQPISQAQLEQYTTQFLQNKENANRIFDEVKAKHVFDYLKNVITLDKTAITSAEFSQLK